MRKTIKSDYKGQFVKTYHKQSYKTNTSISVVVKFNDHKSGSKVL